MYFTIDKVTANSQTKFRKVGDSQDKGGPNWSQPHQYMYSNLEHIESTLTQSVLWLLIWWDPKLFRLIRIRKSSFGFGSEQLPILNEFEEKNYHYELAKFTVS
jgi:hypothetical protein